MNQNLKVMPGNIPTGALHITPDKSITHRALILAALANRPIKICNWLQSLDCKRTLAALQALQVRYELIDTTDIMLFGVGLHGLQDPQQPLDFGNSGTGLRLMTGVLCAQKFHTVVTGDVSLCKRPMRRIIEPLTCMGANIIAVQDQFAPLHIHSVKSLRPITYTLPVASAQVKSAILLASLYCQGNSIVQELLPTRNHTELMLNYMRNTPMVNTLHIPGDFSSAAFFIVAATITPGSDLMLRNVGINPTRIALLTILQQMGANIELQNVTVLNNEPVANIRVRYAKLHGISVPKNLVANAIDEFPILSIAAACAQGNTDFREARELRYKESDRIASLAAGLTNIGVSHSVFEDGMLIYGGGKIRGGVVDSFGDHRIAMAFAVAGLVAESPIIVQDVENIATSYPDFVAAAQSVGFNICVDNSTTLAVVG